MDTTALPRLLTAQQVAQQTGLPLSRIYQLTRTGDLPAVRCGRALRYSVEALLAWIRSGGTAAHD